MVPLSYKVDIQKSKVHHWKEFQFAPIDVSRAMALARSSCWWRSNGWSSDRIWFWRRGFVAAATADDTEPGSKERSWWPLVVPSFHSTGCSGNDKAALSRNADRDGNRDSNVVVNSRFSCCCRNSSTFRGGNVNANWARSCESARDKSLSIEIDVLRCIICNNDASCGTEVMGWLLFKSNWPYIRPASFSRCSNWFSTTWRLICRSNSMRWYWTPSTSDSDRTSIPWSWRGGTVDWIASVGSTLA